MSEIPKEANLRLLADVVGTGPSVLDRDGWDRERLLAYQDDRFHALLTYAVANSKFYRELYAGIDVERSPIDELPTVDKTMLMENFDDAVTDPRLTLEAVERHAATLSGDELLYDEFRVMTSGGTSGMRGWFVWGRDDWRRLLSTILPRGGAWWGMSPPQAGTPGANVYSASPLHMSRRLSATLDTGTSPRLLLPATAPLHELVEALNNFQPHSLMLYPSIGALLAAEQLAGRLRISPSVVVSSSEQLTGDMRTRMEEAWSVHVFNTYSTTETGPVGSECSEHAGIHLWEDMAVIEVVDSDERPVPAGATGAKVLVTNLLNLTQPIIRYEVNDLLTLSEDPCPCGRPFAVLAAVEGRSDDVLHIPGRSGVVSVHPKVFRDVIGAFGEVLQYQVTYRPGVVDISVIASPETADQVRSAMIGRLESSGVNAVEVVVQAVRAIARETSGSGKFKLVRNLAGSPAPEPVGS